MRKIWLEKLHHPITLSRFGFSLLLTGSVGENRATFRDITLVLKQGIVELSPKFVSIRTGLLSPKLATQALGRFVENLDKGFAISATFPPDKRIVPGLACLEATILWSDGFEHSLRLATTTIQMINSYRF